jgi:hypothetical protein
MVGLNGHVSLNGWLESEHVSLKNNLVAHVVAYAISCMNMNG